MTSDSFLLGDKQSEMNVEAMSRQQRQDATSAMQLPAACCRIGFVEQDFGSSWKFEEMVMYRHKTHSEITACIHPT
jgi:hypothetical protein